MTRNRRAELPRTRFRLTRFRLRTRPLLWKASFRREQNRRRIWAVLFGGKVETTPFEYRAPRSERQRCEPRARLEKLWKSFMGVKLDIM